MQVSLPKVVAYKKQYVDEVAKVSRDVFTSEDVRVEFDGVEERKHIEEHKQEIKAKDKDLRRTLTIEQRLKVQKYSFGSARKYAGVLSQLYLTSEDWRSAFMFKAYDIFEDNQDIDFELFLYRVSVSLVKDFHKEQRGLKTAVNTKKSQAAHRTDIVYNDNQLEDTTNNEDNKVDWADAETTVVDGEFEIFTSGKKKGQLKFKGRTEQWNIVDGQRVKKFSRKYLEFLRTYQDWKNPRIPNVKHEDYDKIKVEVMQPTYKPYSLDYMAMAKLGEFTTRQIEAKKLFKKRVIAGAVNKEDDKVSANIKSQILSYIGVMANDVSMQAKFMEDLEMHGIDTALVVLNAKVSPINKK